MYVNGVQITSFVTTVYTNSFNAGAVGGAYAHYIGKDAASSTNYLDAYLAEVNVINAQQLTPSSFGAYSTNGVWQPARYTGSYGTNGFYLPFSSTSSAETLAYDYSNTNPELVSNGMFVSNVTGWTATGAGSPSVTWLSTHNIRVANSTNNLVSAYTAITTVVGQTYYAQAYLTAASIGGTARTISLIKADTAAYNGTNAVTLASTTQAGAPTGLQGTFVATATTTYIVLFVDVVGTGTTGADFTQVSVALGGYKKNWNPFNISTTAGTTYDPMLDSPTLTSATVANYAVLNPIAPTSAGTVSAANLVLSGTASTGQRPATMGFSSGKFYWEITSNWDSTQGSTQIGISKDTVALTTYPGQSADSYSIYIGGSTTIYTYNNATATARGTTPTSPVVLQVAVDLTNSKVWFGINNTWVTGNPSTGTSATYTITNAGTYLPCFRTSGGTNTTTQYVNFGQQGFVYTPPTGFVALNAYNLPTPTIANGATVMAATTYTGNGSTQSILNSNNTTTSVSFQPDLVWLKARNSATSNYLFDAVRGVSNYLISDSTAAEATAGNTLTAFNSNGFSLSSSAGVNFNTNTYIAWQWKAGGSTSTNTSGTITSTVSVNATAGFSVVTWTGTGASGASVGHGLSTLPQFVIIKKRNVAENWYVAAYATQGLNYAYHLFLNTTGALSASNDPYLLSGQSSLTSSTLALADGTSNNGGNQNGTTYVAYCWTPISGYSAFGSYTGNGSTDGPFIYTGFRPRWVMVKGTAITSWYVWDSSRATYNVMNETLYPNLSNAESGSGGIIDFLSNGFKLRTTASDLNSSGATQIYAAFAENPFKYALAR